MTRSGSLTWLGVVAVGMFAACACPDDHDGAGDVEAPWLLAIDEDEATIDALIQISVEPGFEGEVTVLCEDLELPVGFPSDTNFTSLAYADGILYASAGHDTWGDTLMRIDPCACTATQVGSYGFTLVSGLASNRRGSLFGVAADDDVMIEVDPATADAEPRATLSSDWGSHGLTWTGPTVDRLYGLDAATDRLHWFAGAEATPLESVATSKDFATAGLEFHPGRGLLYACGVRDQETALATIDPESGLVQIVAESVFTTACDNLAGPAEPIHCAS